MAPTCSIAKTQSSESDESATCEILDIGVLNDCLFFVLHTMIEFATTTYCTVFLELDIWYGLVNVFSHSGYTFCV